jgi:hypothetical protein
MCCDGGNKETQKGVEDEMQYIDGNHQRDDVVAHQSIL